MAESMKTMLGLGTKIALKSLKMMKKNNKTESERDENKKRNKREWTK